MYYPCLELAFTVAICGEREAVPPLCYLCLELAFTVGICGERGAGACSIIRVWNWLLQLLSVGRGKQGPAVLSMFGTGFYLRIDL